LRMKLKAAKPIKVSHGALDDPAEWPRLMLQDAPTFDVIGFQKSIDRVVGLSPSGQPVVRLKWARDCKKPLNTEWDFAGNATKTELMQKYCAYRVDIENQPGDYVEVSPPRWVLEERYEPGQYEGSWDSARYINEATELPQPTCRYCKCFDWIDSRKSEGVLLHCRHCGEINLVPFVRKDMVGPAPRDGWYNALPVIGIVGIHNKITKEKFGPWGAYRVPDQSDIEILRRAVHLRSKDAECNPHEALSAAALEQARQWGLQMIDEQRKSING